MSAVFHELPKISKIKMMELNKTACSVDLSRDKVTFVGCFRYLQPVMVLYSADDKDSWETRMTKLLPEYISATGAK